MIVLDTHAALWWPTAPGKLGRAARRACERADRIGISAITFWELGILSLRGRIKLGIPVAEWMREVLSGPRIEALPVTPEIAVLAAGLGMHADPADRLITATALHHRCRLVTRDESIRAAGIVETIWA